MLSISKHLTSRKEPDMPNSFLNQIVNQAARAWAETDAAQRRLFEIRTGIPVPSRRERRRAQSASELERLYAQPHQG